MALENYALACCLVNKRSVQYVGSIRVIIEERCVPLVVWVDKVLSILMDGMHHSVWKPFFKSHHMRSLIRCLLHILLNLIRVVVILILKLVSNLNKHCIIYICCDFRVLVRKMAFNCRVLREFSGLKLGFYQSVSIFLKKSEILLVLLGSWNIFTIWLKNCVLFIWDVAL